MVIIQGVTPKITLTCSNFNPNIMTKIEVVCKNGELIIARSKEEMELTDNSIIFYLTQNETINLKTYYDVSVQVRVATGNVLFGGIEEIKVSNIKKIPVSEFIGEGVL